MIETTTSELTELEIETAAQYLVQTRDNLLQAVADLSDRQWSFKPTPESWSIAEIVEHLALIETFIPLRIGQMGESPTCPENFARAEMDALIVREVPKRNTKVAAPERAQPSNGWSGPECTERFVQSRECTRGLLLAPFLRGRVQQHPVFGLWEGYHWLLATAAHTARHTAQIHEVKAAPGFPI